MPSAVAACGNCRRKVELMNRTKYIPWSVVVTAILPGLVFAQASPFLTGVTSLQENILEWLTPVAIILVMVLGGMAMANRVAQVNSTYGADAQTIIENCANSLILRCSGSDNGGTSHFASRLIGDREIIRRQTTRGRDREAFVLKSARRSTNITTQHVTEAAVMPSELEQLPDLAGYLKTASSPAWRRVRLARPR